MNKIKCFKIDSEKEEISEIQIDSEYGMSFKEIRKHVATLSKEYKKAAIEEKQNEDNILYVDNENLQKAYKHIKLEDVPEEEQKKLEVKGFRWEGQETVHLIVGNGLIIGTNYIDEDIDSNLTLEEVKDLVHFRTFIKEEVDMELMQYGNKK